MDYGFYLAEIVDVAQPKDNRLGVRVLPYMKDIQAGECPLWPSFFKDSLYTGKTGELVWVLCDNEFSIGYVFGPANYTTYPDIIDSSTSTVYEKSGKMSLSIPTDLRDKITQSSADVLGKYLNLENIKVTYWDDNCVHYVERDTGGMVIAYKSGSFYIFRQNEMVIKIGPSLFKIDANSFGASAESIKLQSEYVGLGDSSCAGNVVVTNGATAEGAYVSKSVHA